MVTHQKKNSYFMVARKVSQYRNGVCIVDIWDDLKREIEKQFYFEDVIYIPRRSLKRLKHIRFHSGLFFLDGLFHSGLWKIVFHTCWIFRTCQKKQSVFNFIGSP